MNNTDKPEALRIADDLKARMRLYGHSELDASADIELRRLHAECERLRADAERLNWMSEHEARIGWNREGDACRVWVRTDNDELAAWLPVCGWNVNFPDHRAAIDAARKGEA